MEVIPAIDIKGGRAVRLYQGDYARETIFSDDPVAVAMRWQEAGASRLHVVDLDGAREGRPVNHELIGRIARALVIPMQVGGGIRSLEAAEQVLAMGAKRVVIGTAAIEEPALVEEACARHGEGIIISVDAREGMVATRGWREATQVSVEELIKRMKALGARRFLCTDIAKDGTLSEPSFGLYERLVELNVAIIASGGVARTEDLVLLARIGVEGAIVGRALYTGDVDLRQALARVEEEGRVSA